MSPISLLTNLMLAVSQKKEIRGKDLNTYCKSTSFILILILNAYLVKGQDFAFAKPLGDELELKSYTKDSSANAVILKEFGTAHISSQDGNLIFDYHVKLKIFNSKGYKNGNIEIPLRKSDANTFEKISNIRAITYYPDEQGLIRSSELDPKQIFKESKAGKYHDLVKFALPNVRDGSIIEYSYTIESPFIRRFRNWEFQSGIPKIFSEFCARIPAVYNYNVTLKGPYKLSRNNAVLEKECFQPGGGFKADCSKITYAMADIPAFVEEDYMTAASNFKSAMSFELSDYTDYNGGKHQLAIEWKDVDKDLKSDESFGVQLKKKDFFAEKLSPYLKDVEGDLEKSKAIFSFTQKWFKWNNYVGFYTDLGLKKAFESHTGNIGDINLFLVSALSSVGLAAEPVILSTRSNGLVNTLFPVLSDFDYVVCRLTLADKSYLLDASDPLLPFGLLPLRCINDKGRVIPFAKPSYWIDLAASQRETQIINLDLSLNETGLIKGDMQISSLGYEAYNKRLAIKKFNTVDDYIEDLDEHYSHIKFSKARVSNIDSIELPLRESFFIEFKAQETDQISMNPHFMNRISENPFKLSERTYPVDMGAAADTRLRMQLKFPEGYSILSKPEPIALKLPDTGGRFITQTSVDGNTLILIFDMQLNKSVYSPDEYFYLKELFNKIIQSQQSSIIIKKI